MTIKSSSIGRVLPAQPYASLDEYLGAGGGVGLRDARLVSAEVVIGELEASGLRGRGGAGFPTGTKWRTVSTYASDVLSTSMVVNAAEGEPGTFKDRSILLANPYAVLEGALIGAYVVGARDLIIATKARFTDVIARLRSAIEEIRAAGWADDVEITIEEGPGEYLYGEETALLEVLDGRAPFPRIAPPWRRGVVEVVETDADARSGSGLSADVEMASPAGGTGAPPVLVNNVETLANVPAIIALGAAWFRELGTADSPGTIVCTVTGSVRRAGVVEVAMGTPLRRVIQDMAGGPEVDRMIACVLMGVSNAVLTPDELDLEISYEAMRARGSGLGSASFIVIDDSANPVSVAAGASRFLAIESCGQCTPCKHDGLQISRLLDTMVSGNGVAGDLTTIRKRLGTVADGARCSLASQHQVVVSSILDAFGPAFEERVGKRGHPVPPVEIAELFDIEGDTAVNDPEFASKQPDWTHGTRDSGQSPAARLGEHRNPLNAIIP